MPLQGVLQTRWLRGLQSAFGIFSQPPNSLPRLSNLVLTRRGSLQTTPGSLIISSYANGGPLPWDPTRVFMWKDIFYFNPNNNPAAAGYYGLFETNLPPPRLPNPTDPGGVGTPAAAVETVTGSVAFNPATTQFAITAADGVGGETLLSPPTPVITVGANQGVKLTWHRIPTAAGYNIYMLNAGVWERIIPFGSPNTFGSITIPENPASQLPVWMPNTPYTANVSKVQTFPTLINGQIYVFMATKTATSTGLGPPDWAAFPLIGDITPPPVEWINQGPAPLTLSYLIAQIPPANLPKGNPQNVTSVIQGATQPSPDNTTQSLEFLSIPVSGTGWNFTNAIFSFPADMLPNPGGGGIGRGGGGGGGGAIPTGGGGTPGTISGGVLGVVSPIPQIIQFADLMFLALGNGVTPYYSNGTAGGTHAITNTFQATIPFWQPGIGYIVGDQVVPADGDTRLFTAVQGGISGSPNPPAWPNTIDQTIADGQVIWKYISQVVPPPPPQGATHVEVFANSLWVANTRPAFSQAFPSDGPSAIWMSDANNPNSWNPLNTAQISRDDGTEIMGIKAFSVAQAGIPTSEQLVIFKNFSTYIINGVFGAADFSIQQAMTDQGCIAPRSIQFVPGFGLMRLTHLGFSYFDSVSDKLMSTDLHPYLFGDPNQPDIIPIDWGFAYFSKGAQVADPPMYVCAVPVLGANGPNDPLHPNLLAPLPVAQFTLTPSPELPLGFPAGTYWFRITLRSLVAETAITPQIGPITLAPTGTTGGFTISSNTPLPPGATGWRIYWGSNGPNSETHFQDTGPELFSPTGIQTLLTFPGSTITGPPMGISGTLTRIFCYDLTLRCWTVIDLPFSISVLRQFRVLGQPPTTISGGFFDSTVRRLFANATDWDGIPISWSLRSTEVYNQGGDMRVHYRRVRVRGQGLGPINVTANYEGTDDAILPAIFWALGGNQFVAESNMMNEAMNAHATVSGQGQVLIDSLDFHATPTVIGAGPVIS